MRMKVIVTGIFALITISLCTGIAQAQSLGTYGDYSRMFEKSAGQFWSGNWRNQWAWEPQGGGVSYIKWGDPDQWPPANYEKFEKSDDGKWILLDGFGSNTSFLKQRVTKEQIGDVSCRNMKPLQKVEGGKQHYVKWDIQSEPFCLEAWGQIINPNAPDVDFYHKQVWFGPSGPWCDNMYHQDKTCNKQYEVWKDNNDNGKIGGPMELRIERDNIFAKGMGPAYIIHNYFPNNGWHADMRYSWTW
ncbi:MULTISPECIES: hypothetical protein [Bacillus]|uniref:Uncharacterized protein n=2 Tax=Bacillus TaxID=1386 RepID=A0A0M4FNT7_9BACI|nr:MULTISPECIES: hypothetical protein [Bacillus]ALC80598.1 hypothetical protein AM592_02635 [Bacillus gobiensis]MBP1083694.1 hypothetical protein [Bacillus capparidis]MED1094882.1 hypothetical protein [Bacillus capparidis]